MQAHGLKVAHNILMKVLQKVLVCYAVGHVVMSNRKALEKQCIERAVMKVGTTFAANA